MEKHYKYLLSLLTIFILGISLGFFISKNTRSNGPPEEVQEEVRLGGYKYINPLLVCENSQSIGEKEYKPSKAKILALINGEKEKGTISDAAVYYRDLNNGPWFGINERDNFSPASLLKIPVMIAYYKKSETDPSLLSRKLLFMKKEFPNILVVPIFTQHQSLEEGKSYTVDELIERMIIYSDNDALFLLQDNIDNKLIDKVTEDLGIETATESTPDDYMSVKSYASLLRVLYNASYLNQILSEKALEILTRSLFKGGIKMGVPSDIIVAHKYGERELLNGVKQLHDCGIIYYPKRTYLLCIMTRGKDYQVLSDTIEKISAAVYTNITQKFSGNR